MARKLAETHFQRGTVVAAIGSGVYDEELVAELEHHLTYEYEHLADVDFTKRPRYRN